MYFSSLSTRASIFTSRALETNKFLLRQIGSVRFSSTWIRFNPCSSERHIIKNTFLLHASFRRNKGVMGVLNLDKNYIGMIAKNYRIVYPIVGSYISGECGCCSQVDILESPGYKEMSLLEPEGSIEYVRNWLNGVTNKSYISELYNSLKGCDEVLGDCLKDPILYLWSGVFNKECVIYQKSGHFNTFHDLSNLPIYALSNAIKISPKEERFATEVSAGIASMHLTLTTTSPCVVVFNEAIHLNSDLFFNEFGILAYQILNTDRKVVFIDSSKTQVRKFKKFGELEKYGVNLENIPISVENKDGKIVNTSFTMQDYFDYLSNSIKKIENLDYKELAQNLLISGMLFREGVIKSCVSDYSLQAKGAEGRFQGFIGYLLKQELLEINSNNEVLIKVPEELIVDSSDIIPEPVTSCLGRF